MPENSKNGKFDQNDYMRKYRQIHKSDTKTLKADVKSDIFDKITDYCKKMSISKAEFLSKAALYIIDNDLLSEIKTDK